MVKPQKDRRETSVGEGSSDGGVAGEKNSGDRGTRGSELERLGVGSEMEITEGCSYLG